MDKSPPKEKMDKSLPKEKSVRGKTAATYSKTAATTAATYSKSTRSRGKALANNPSGKNIEVVADEAELADDGEADTMSPPVISKSHSHLSVFANYLFCRAHSLRAAGHFGGPADAISP